MCVCIVKRFVGLFLCFCLRVGIFLTAALTELSLLQGSSPLLLSRCAGHCHSVCGRECNSVNMHFFVGGADQSLCRYKYGLLLMLMPAPACNVLSVTPSLSSPPRVLGNPFFFAEKNEGEGQERKTRQAGIQRAGTETKPVIFEIFFSSILSLPLGFADTCCSVQETVHFCGSMFGGPCGVCGV